MELTTKIENLELGQYLTRILAWNHIHTLGHLLTIPKEHLSKLDNLGVKRANYIINVVHEAGFYFKNDDTIFYYNDNIGLKKIITYSELRYNDNLLFYVTFGT